jgi:hypothetical protein
MIAKLSDTAASQIGFAGTTRLCWGQRAAQTLLVKLAGGGQWVIAAMLAVSVSEISHIFAKQKSIVMSRR